MSDFSALGAVNPFLHTAAATAAAFSHRNAEEAERTGRDKKLKESAAKKPFSHLLKSVDEAPLDTASPLGAIADLPPEEAVAALVGNVHESGTVLSEHPNADSIIAYKKAVGAFIDYVVKNGITVVKEEGKRTWVKKGDPAQGFHTKVYSDIIIINNKLERLAADIMQTQMDRLALLARIEEVNGLVVDLLE